MNQQAPTTTTTRDSARDVASRGAEEAKQLSHEVMDGARQLVRTGRDEVREQLEHQTTRAAAAARDAASQLLALADGDAERGERAQSLVRDIGNRLSHLADRLEHGGLDSVARETSGFARRRPMVFLGGIALAGFVAGRYARVLKDRDGHETDRSPTPYQPTQGRPSGVSPTLPVDPVTGTPMVGPESTTSGVSTAPNAALGQPDRPAGFDSPPPGHGGYPAESGSSPPERGGRR